MLVIDLSGRVVLVVGGARGIGASIVEHLCKAGAHAVFTHTGNPAHASRVEALVAAASGEGGRAQSEVVDACDSAAATSLVDRLVREKGRLDLLVCNAGMNTALPAEQLSDDQWNAAIDLNLGAAFYAVRAALPHMLRQGGGRIILIGSSAVYDGGGGALDYAAAKAGMSGMMRYLCRNYARKGISTNIVHPCVIETDLLKKRYADPDARTKLEDEIPVGRLGRPEDIGGLVAFLASSWGDYICGQEILADGDRTLFGR